jgi:hypothetical protein
VNEFLLVTDKAQPGNASDHRDTVGIELNAQLTNLTELRRWRIQFNPGVAALVFCHYLITLSALASSASSSLLIQS